MADRKEYNEFVRLSKLKLGKGLHNLERQAWNPSEIASAIFKISDDQGNYLCTGTLVGQRLYVVNHAMDASLTKTFKAHNTTHTLELDPARYEIMNKEIGAFYTSGVPSKLKTSALKVMTDSAIVTIYGYGDGQRNTPDIITGFASPLGWCCSRNRNGDCSSPALDENGKIVGFWTHGNGSNFGRFEPITENFIKKAQQQLTTHSGMDFRSRPLNL